MSTEQKSTEAYLLGMSMGSLLRVQELLIQGNDKEALSVINEAMRSLKDKVEKHFYSHLQVKAEKVEVDNDSA